jgi:hypothetical protein
MRHFYSICLFVIATSTTAFAKPPGDTTGGGDTGPSRMIVLGDDGVNGFQAFPFTSINSLWCKTDGSIHVSHIRISDRQLFDTTVDANPADPAAACQAWLDYLNGVGPQPPIRVR